MRIAYISADPGVPVFGHKGCSVHVQEVLRALTEQGADITLFAASFGGDPPPGLSRISCLPLPPLPKGDRAERERAALAVNNDLTMALRQHGYFDMIYERYSLWSFAGMEYAREIGVPGILEVNAPLIDEQEQYRVLVDRDRAERVAEQVFSAARFLVAVSDEVAVYLAQYGDMHSRIRVIPNGVDPARFPAGLEPACPAPAGILTIGFVGSLKKWHGLSVLVEAFALLHVQHPQTRLLIVGHGPERESLEADVIQRGLTQAVDFTGAVTPALVPGMLASMDIAAAPYPELSHFYFSPLKVYEYMAAGLPVVASRVGQLDTLIEDDRTGILCPPGDANALADALERLLENPALRAQIGVSGRALVLEKYTWSAVAQHILCLAEDGSSADAGK